MEDDGGKYFTLYMRGQNILPDKGNFLCVGKIAGFEQNAYNSF